jgi:phospholipase C
MSLFDGLSRRDFLRLTAAAAGGVGALTAMAGPVIDRAYAVDPCGTGSLDDIEHFVLLMMENRSFDHYYGTMSGVRGFRDAQAKGTLKQYYDPTQGGEFLYPFRLDTTHGASLDGECINDPTHNWGPQHQVWNGGRMDQWLKVHVANEGAANGPATLGYYEREDVPVHRALAEAFTVCDHYFCSVLGPTDPNRLYWISGTIDPEGKHGGPLLDTPTLIPNYKYSWRTFPENLEEAGVSWKIYNDATPGSSAVLSGMTQSFTQYNPATNPTLFDKGLGNYYQTNFKLDVATGNLPSVSWIIPPLLNCEHPALPPSFGAATLIEVLDTLTANPAIWEKTALIINYDENGGFYDHVPPPTAPRGTPGEYVTVNPLPSTAESISGPIGLGFRVPGLVISPYSRGGLVASETFDHTSQLRLIGKRFGVDVPNLTDWRKKTVGDMTSTFDFATPADKSTPTLAATSELSTVDTLLECKVGIDGLSGTFAGQYNPSSYPLPANEPPVQSTTPARRAPSGPAPCATTPTQTQTPPHPASPTTHSTPIPVRAAAGAGRTRIGAAGDSLHAEGLADTGPDQGHTLLSAAALLGAGAVTAAAAGRIGRTVDGAAASGNGDAD